MKNIPLGKGALSMAHAGHELMLHSFIEQVKPYIFILTDGSTRNNLSSRVQHTHAYLSALIPESKNAFSILSKNGNNFPLVFA